MSEIIKISLLIIGTTAVFPIKSLYRLSLGFTQSAVSPSIVSGLVVAMVKKSSESLTAYFI